MSTRAFDLDAFLTEVQGEPIELALLGRVWTFAPELPATALLRLRAAAANDDYEGSDDDDISLLREMMQPGSQVDELLAAGVTASGLAVMIRVVMGVYGGASPEETLETIRAEREQGNEKNAEAPKEAAV